MLMVPRDRQRFKDFWRQFSWRAFCWINLNSRYEVVPSVSGLPSRWQPEKLKFDRLDSKTHQLCNTMVLLRIAGELLYNMMLLLFKVS